MKITPRNTLIGLVFVLSVAFFIGALSRMLYQSKAQSANKINVFINEKTLECSNKGTCVVHIFGSTIAGNKVAGVQGTFSYSDELEVVGLVKDEFCTQASFGLNDQFDFTDNPTTHTATFALSQLKANDVLTDGTKCITGVTLKPKAGTVAGTTGKFVLSNAPSWKAGGSVPLTVDLNTDPTIITVTDTVPTVTPPTTLSPTAVPTGTTCVKKSKGDCSCDDKIDMTDWEFIRNFVRGEGKSCSPLDLKTWIENNELIP